MSLPGDVGPIYAETDMARFPVEPLNTISNLIFLVLVIFWAYKTRMSVGRYPLIVIALPLLFSGFIGGTAYHACRCSNLWLQLDYLPIFLLVVLTAIFFWVRLFREDKRLFCFGVLLVTVNFFIFLTVTPGSRHAIITFGYINFAILIILPAIVCCYGRGWQYAQNLGIAFVAFCAAILCRALDDGRAAPILPMGTHFLWHLLGGAAVFFIIRYEYEISQCEISSSK